MKKGELTKSLRNEGWVPFESREYEVKDDDGNVVGKIGYKAAKAINEGRLFKYTPSGADEEKVFSYLRKKQNDAQRRAEQREYLRSTASSRQPWTPNTIENSLTNTGDIGRNKNNDDNMSVADELFSLAKNKSNTRAGNFKPAEVPNLHDRETVKREFNAIKANEPNDNTEYEVPINNNKQIKIKYGIKKRIDSIANQTELSSDKRAKRIDDLIERLELNDDEKKNAISYAGIKKLGIASEASGKDGILKEITQPVVKFLQGTYDAANSASRFIFKDGMKIDGDYTQAYNDAAKYYAENPDQLGNDLFNSELNGLSTPKGDYLRDVNLDKILEIYNDTTKASQFISDAGFRSAGQMLGDMAIASMGGVPDAIGAVKNTVGAVAAGTRAAEIASKVANISPKIKEVAGAGVAAKAANAVIGKVNSVSIGKAIGFLNPLDNPTTALMGISAAQEKYDNLKQMGYDDETAKKNALFTGYVSTITEKMGYDGTSESLYLLKNKYIAGSASASANKNTKKIIRDYLSANVSEGVEEIYNTVLERTGDVFSKIGYVDENGEIRQRKIFGNDGIFDIIDISENFLGGFVGGAVMGSVGLISNIAQHDADTVREYADTVRRQVETSNKIVRDHAKTAGAENITLPDEPDWNTATIDEINEYYQKAVDAHINILSDENVIKNDEEVVRAADNVISQSDVQNDTIKDTSENTSVSAAESDPDSVMHDVKENLSATGELGDIMSSEAVVKYTPETASGEIKRLENILIAKGADDVSRQEIVGTALEIEKTLDGTNKTIRSVFDNVSKITSGAVSEIQNKAGLSSSYWKLFGENFKAIPSGNVKENIELVTEYANAYAEALKNDNPEKYNSIMVGTNGANLSSELPQTVLNNVIPTNVQNAGEYKLAATQIKNIVSDVDVRISNERAEIYGAKADVAASAAENTKPAPVEESKGSAPKDIALTQVGDFYEAYGDDAIILAKKLNLMPTTKVINGTSVQTVGFPVSSLENYKNTLGSEYNLNVTSAPVESTFEDFPEFTNDMLNEDEETDTTTDIAMADGEVTPVVNALNDTLYPEAKLDILKIAKRNNVSNGLEVFAKNIKAEYENTGTIEKFSGYFKDDGKKVIKAITGNTPKDIGKKNKIVRTKKADWPSHDVVWFAPNSKTVIAYSTRAASDFIEALVDDNPAKTISEIRDMINYDEEAKRVLQKYIDSGFGDDIASEHFSHRKSVTSKTETPDSVSENTNVVENKTDSVTETPENISETNSVVSEEKTSPKKINELFKKLTDSIPLLENDAAVYAATGKEFEPGEKKLSQQVYEYFESLGGVVHRENFGDVAINDKGVDSSIAHGMGRAKAIAFASVPAVIEKGRQIDFVEKWKGRNYDSYVFAAPIQIGTQRAFVGVVVTKSGTDNRYYLHEVSDNEGNIIIIKKDDVSFKSKSKATNDSSSLGETSPANSISQDNENVNSSVRNDAENDASKVYDVAYFEKLGSDIRKGESVSLKDVRTAVDAILLNHGEAIKAELSQLKNDELKKHLSIYDRGRITKKAEMVDSIYTDMLSSLYYALSGKDTVTYIYDGTGFESQQSKMLFDISRELNEETFNKRLAENAEKYKKQVAAREEKLAKVKNPQTLEDYEYKKRYFGLSDEETIQYENLYAEERRKARENKKSAKTIKDTSGADAFFANTDNYTIEKTTHTKTGEDVWVVRPTNRLETEEWKRLNEQIKALGGSYWRGNQGWNFKKDPTAALSSTEETETVTAKGSTNAEKLRAVAEGMQKAIDDKFRDRLTNTAKRAREAASAEAEGERLKRLQDTINNIADALENGENTLLDKIDSKAQVETLMSMLRTGRRNRISETLPDITYDERLQEQDKPYSNDDAKYAEYPLTKLHENIVSGYLRAAEGKTGYKQIADRLKKALKTVKNGYVTVDAQMLSDIDKIVQNLSPFYEELWNDGVAERKRLARMGIENVVELRAYLRELIKFLPGRNIEAEKQRAIKEKERQLANAKIEGFFPTPKAIVKTMLDEADIKPDEKVLEPSAGKGNIADAIRESYPDNALDVVEWNASLNELLSEKGHNVVGVDFLQHSGEYDKIIMNPPFEKGQDIDHIRHAYSLLNDSGRVVCIMSEGPFYRNDKKATEFREWLNEVGGVSEKLPEGSFKNSERSTGVNTRLVVIDKVAKDTKKIIDDVNAENAKYSISKGEGLTNEQKGNYDLPENVGRNGDARSSVKSKPMFRIGKGALGKRGRQKYVEKLDREYDTEREVINKTVKAEFIREHAYNDDMREMESDLKALGFDKVGFFVGAGRLVHRPLSSCSAVIFEDSKEVYLRYDDEDYSPRQLAVHEYGHEKYNSKLGRKIKHIVENSIPLAERNAIMQQKRYKLYAEALGDPDLVFEEFVCDILGGMTDYSYTHFENLMNAFWNQDFEFIDNYKVSEYTNSIDAGGVNADVIDSTGFGNDYRLSASNQLYLPAREYAMVSKAIMAKNAGLADNELKPIDYVYAADEFYIYENNSLGDFTVVDKLDTVNDADKIDDVKELIDNGTYANRKGFNRWADGVRGREGSNTGINSRSENRRPTVGNDRLSAEQQRSNTVGYSSGVGEYPENKKVRFSIAENDAEELTPERKKQIFEQFEKDRAGIDKPTQKQLWGERAAWVAHNMTRVFPNIPERGERGTFFAEFRKSMIQWKSLPTTASFMVQDKLNKMTEGLTPEEFKTFSELVYFLDLQEEAQIQKDRGYTEILLPNEITPVEVDAIVKVLNEEATENVKQALIKRQNIWDALKSQYIELNRYIGFDTDGKFKRKNYYHHQVIEYMNNGGKGTGSREIGIKAGRGWLKERQGSTKAINTDFLAVEYKAMLQMQYDVYIAETLGKIKKQYDIKPQLEDEAFRNNKNALNEIIKKEATDKDGNIKLDSKGKPDSETYRKQMWYNSRIMFGFDGLFDLAERNELPTYDGEYAKVVEALKRHELNVPGLYKYVGIIASTDLPDNATDAQEQAVLNARTVLKYTSQKREWIKNVLADSYQTWETIAKSMSDTHTIHQPRRGNYFYTKTVVDEDAFNNAYNEMVLSLASGEIDLGNVDLNKLFTQYADTVRLTGAAYEQWVLPNEIVTTMDEIANPKQVNAGQKIGRGILSAWKGWATSVNPLRTVKFGLRNLFGDLDAVIAGNPKVTMYSKKAVQDIYRAMRHKKYSPEYMEWIERGGYTSMIFANEMDSEMQDKLFSHLKDKQGVNVFKIPVKMFEKYYNGVENVHNFREAILRYSSYLYFKEAIKRNGGAVKDYVASNKYIVRGLNTVEDKAYQLSKDLLGAYDEVGKLGQTLRRYWVPFYSFTETNLKRYYRLFENIITSDDKIPKKAGKLLLKALMVNMLGLLMVAWNKLVMKEDDDKLPPSVRNVPHLTLGKIGDNVYAFRQLGSFSELLEWFGLEDYKWTSEDLTAPLDKAWGMVTPFAKLPVELASGLNFYPSLTEPRAIRDKWQHFFNSFGVDAIYNEVTGKPTRGVGEILKGSVVYDYDYKESVYYEMLDIKRNYQGKTDNTIYGIDAKSNALYYMKTAVRYKDKEAALKYLDGYFENGGTVKGIKQSFATLNPMYGFTGKDTAEKGEAFISSLTDDEKEKLKIAQDYYENDLMLPENVLDKLGKKDITVEEAKNVLRGYINAKCK